MPRSKDPLLRLLSKHHTLDEWERYTGPQGGKGWINTETGEKVYQEEKPGGEGTENAKSETYETAKSIIEASYDSISGTTFEPDAIREAVLKTNPEDTADALFDALETHYEDDSEGAYKRAKHLLSEASADTLSDVKVTVTLDDGEEVTFSQRWGEKINVDKREEAVKQILTNKGFTDKEIVAYHKLFKNQKRGPKVAGDDRMDAFNVVATVDTGASGHTAKYRPFRPELETLRAVREPMLKALRKMHGDTITLYRGEEDFDNEGEYRETRDGKSYIEFDSHQPAESWSMRPLLADNFGDFILKEEVPIERVVAANFVGAGYDKEAEMLVAMNRKQLWGYGDKLFFSGDEAEDFDDNETVSKKELVTEELRFMKQQLSFAERGLELAEWVKYRGPQGGEGWQNVETGEVTYGDKPKGESAGADDESSSPTANVSPRDVTLDIESDIDDIFDSTDDVDMASVALSTHLRKHSQIPHIEIRPNKENPEQTKDIAKALARVDDTIITAGLNGFTTRPSASSKYGTYNFGRREVKISNGISEERLAELSQDGEMVGDDMEWLVLHEIGHHAHNVNMQLEGLTGEEIRDISKGSVAISTDGEWHQTRIYDVAEQVSNYARTNQIEFVAEMFAGLCMGKTFPDEMMRMYEDYRGPDTWREYRDKYYTGKAKEMAEKVPAMRELLRQLPPELRYSAVATFKSIQTMGGVDPKGIDKQAASTGLTLDDWQRSPTPETEHRWYSPSRDEYRYQKNEPGSGGKSEYEKMREREARRESDIADMPVKERLRNAFSLASDTQSVREAGITAGASVAMDMSILYYPDGSRDFAVPVSAHNSYITRQLTQEDQARANNEVGPELTELFGGKSCEVEIVQHNGEDYIVKEGIDGTMLTDVMLEARDEDREVDPDILDSVMDLMAATWLTGNRDAHGGNIIINGNNEAVLIDHDSGPFSDGDALLYEDWADYEGQKAIRFIEVQTKARVGYEPFIKRGLEVAVRVAEGEIPLPDTLGPEEKEDVRERAMRLIEYNKQWDEFEDYIPERFMKALQAKRWVPHYNKDNVQVGWKDANNPSDIRYQENMPGSAEATEDASEAANATDEAGFTDADYEAAAAVEPDGEKLYELLANGADTDRLAEEFLNARGPIEGPEGDSVRRQAKYDLKKIHEQLTLRYVREEYPITVEVDGEEVEMGVSLGSSTDYLLERMDIRYKSTATRGPLAHKEDKMFRKVEGELGKLTTGARGMGEDMMKMTNALAETVNPDAASLYDDLSDLDIELFEELEDIRKNSVSVLRQVFGDTITLYRGETGAFGREFDEQPGNEKVGEHKPLESWSASPSCAAGFAGDGGYMLKKEIPVEKTMFPWFLGVGFGTEVEVGVAMSERESFKVGEEIFRTPSQDDEEPPNMPEYSNLDVAKDEFAQMQKLAQNMERIKQENEEEDTEGRQLAIARTLDWEGYRTDTGEQAWINTVTGERRYQETKPGTQGDGEDEENQQVEQLPPAESLEQRLDLIDVEEQLIEGAVVTTEDGTKVAVTGATDNFDHIYGKAMQGGDYVNMVIGADDIASVVPSPESSIIQGDIEDIAADNELEVFESSPNMFQASINAGFDEPFPDAITYMDRVAFELDDGAYLIGDVIEKNGHKGSQDPIVRVRTQSGNIRDMNLGDAVGIKSRYEGYDSIADVPTEERLQNPFDFAVERGKLRDYGIMKGGQTGHAMEIITYEDGSRDFLTPLSAMGSGQKAEERAQRNVVQARLGNSMMPGAFAKAERATDPDTGEEFIVKEGIEKRKGGPKGGTYDMPPRSISEPIALGCLLGNADLHQNNVVITEGETYGKAVIIDHDFFGGDAHVSMFEARWAAPGEYMEQVAIDVYNRRDNIDPEGITQQAKAQINKNFKRYLWLAAHGRNDVQNVPAELVRRYEESDGKKAGIAAMPDVLE